MAQQTLDTRKVLGHTLSILAEKDERILGMTADMSFIIPEFKNKFPERFIDVGIAEQNMVSIASGLAVSGMIPFVTTMAAFMTMRPCEQIRTDVCYNNANVKIAGTGGGTAYGNQGNTHMALEDLAILNTFPNIVILIPADGVEAEEAVKAAVKHQGPVYIRLGRGEDPVIYETGYSFGGSKLEFNIGKIVTLKDGSDVTIVAAGCSIVNQALEAAKLLESKGFSATVLNVHTLKPFDRETLLKAARKTGAIVTVEDHQITNGLGATVCQTVAAEGCARVKCLGVPDTFVPMMDQMGLYHHYSMDAEGIFNAAQELIKKK